ncbi:hypothetical protein OIU77_015655 [Salix suchowensis]|uniref:Uncharacterized protein n=1 Tax=Salix suchowensis TaxID=1278906 RepID=A0ABQ8ZI01_9ROSI|nr:hypothetical protein OIU77_015655 [Salix suchowensis]
MKKMMIPINTHTSHSCFPSEGEGGYTLTLHIDFSPAPQATIDKSLPECRVGIISQMSSCRLLVILGFPMDSCLACPTNRYLSCPPLQASNHKGDLGCKLQYFNFGEQQTKSKIPPFPFSVSNERSHNISLSPLILLYKKMFSHYMFAI